MINTQKDKKTKTKIKNEKNIKLKMDKTKLQKNKTKLQKNKTKLQIENKINNLKNPYKYKLIKQDGGWRFGFDTTPGVSGSPFPGQMIGDIFGLVKNAYKAIDAGIDLIGTTMSISSDMGSLYTGPGEPGVNL